MKSRLLKAVLLTMSAWGAFGSASAETLHARIPFEFSVAGTTMPAGSYLISTVANTPNVLLFENEATKAQSIVFVRRGPARAVGSPPPMTFASDSGDRMALTKIATGASAYELSAYPARDASKRVALTLAAGK